MTFADHVDELARQLGVDVLFANHPEYSAAVAVPFARVIVIAPVTDELTYAAALHELGHHATTTRDATDPVDELELERAAWQWAQQHALDWSPTMEHLMQVALHGYVRAAAAYVRAKAMPRSETPRGFLDKVLE